MEPWEIQQRSIHPEVRERAVRLFEEHVHEYPSRRAAMQSLAGKIGCTAETLRSWVQRAEALGLPGLPLPRAGARILHKNLDIAFLNRLEISKRNTLVLGVHSWLRPQTSSPHLWPP